jgi:plasmid stability protein
MQVSQIRAVLPEATISSIKTHAKRHGLSYNAMCSRILENGVSQLTGESCFLLANAALIARLDIINSQLRSKSTEEKQHAEYHEYPQEIAAYSINQLGPSSDTSP